MFNAHNGRLPMTWNGSSYHFNWKDLSSWIRPALTVAGELGAGALLMGSTCCSTPLTHINMSQGGRWSTLSINWTEHCKTWTHSHTAPRVTCHVSRVTAAHLAGPQPHARDSAAAVTRLTLVTRQLLRRTHRRHSPSPPRRTACCPWWPLGWGGGSPGSPTSPGRSPRPDWAQDGRHCSVFTVASAAPGLLPSGHCPPPE